MAPKSDGTANAPGRVDPPGGATTPSPSGERASGGNSTRALLVGAVSTADRDQDPENQLRPLRAAASRKGWEFEEVVFRQSRFDGDSYREVADAVLRRLEGGGFDVLAVWAWDRISRQGAEEAFRFLRHLEDHLSVRFFSLQEPFLCTEAGREQRDLLLPIIAWVANKDSQRRSDRLVAKAQTKRISSAKLGQRSVWGKGRMATPEEVAAIRARRGEGIRPLAREFGLSKSQVERILKGGVKSA